MILNRMETHLWSDGAGPRPVQYHGRTILHHRCLRCGRDFAQGFEGRPDWKAVYIGLLSVERLSDSVTARWLAEECPGVLLAADTEDRAERRIERQSSKYELIRSRRCFFF